MPSTACGLTFSAFREWHGNQRLGQEQVDQRRQSRGGSSPFERHAQDLPCQREPVQVFVPAVRRGGHAREKPGHARAEVLKMRPPV